MEQYLAKARHTLWCYHKDHQLKLPQIHTQNKQLTNASTTPPYAWFNINILVFFSPFLVPCFPSSIDRMTCDNPNHHHTHSRSGTLTGDTNIHWYMPHSVRTSSNTTVNSIIYPCKNTGLLTWLAAELKKWLPWNSVHPQEFHTNTWKMVICHCIFKMLSSTKSWDWGLSR